MFTGDDDLSRDADATIVAIQEVKSSPEDLDDGMATPLNRNGYGWDDRSSLQDNLQTPDKLPNLDVVGETEYNKGTCVLATGKTCTFLYG